MSTAEDSLSEAALPFFSEELNYHLRTFGCQMNKHDSERIAGQLEALGAHSVDSAEAADVVIFMTCCVREAADVRLLGQVASLKNLPPRGTGILSTQPARLTHRIIAVGGCIGQRDGEKLAEQMPHIDIVFGTHNIAHFPALLAAALEKQRQVEVISDAAAADLEAQVYDLPQQRQQPWQAWLPIMTGCDNYCSYCIVPYVRGRERSRDFADVVRDAESLVGDGVVEITLLGQNVNSYGRDLYGEPRFAEILRAIAATGVRRLRFATSHPKDLSPQTIAAFAETPSVMPHLHLPAQSGSDRILAAMNRHYTADHYRQLVADLRAACTAAGKPRLALSTDIIVGYPGETEADFADTCALVRDIGFAQVFTFIYSRREGTPAAALYDDTPHAIVQERFDRLVELVQESAWEQNQPDLGQVLDVLIEGVSKRNASMLAGKSERNQTVHAQLPGVAEVATQAAVPPTANPAEFENDSEDGAIAAAAPALASHQAEAADYVGRILPIRITEAKTWYLRGELL